MFDSYNPAILNEALQKGAGGSGGGTNVVANPEGAATTELSKLQVGEVIYSLFSGMKFSITEFDTGMKWLSNETIYGKVIDIPALSDTIADTIYGTAITNLDKIIAGFCFMTTSAGNVFTLPHYNLTISDSTPAISATGSFDFNVVSDGTVKIRTTSDASAISAKALVLYTKTASEAKKSSKKK